MTLWARIKRWVRPSPAPPVRLEHHFTGVYGVCKGCGLYVEECFYDRYCAGRPIASRRTHDFDTAGECGCGVLAEELQAHPDCLSPTR